jgi:SAM-dependent methyltransferase
VRARLIARHYVDAALPVPHLREAPAAYRRYLRDRRRYVELSGERLYRYDDDPQLFDRTATTPFDPHYTHQDAWAAREIFQRRPDEHVDVGSRVTFVLGLAAFVPVTFVDLRPLPVEVPNLSSRQGSLLAMPFEDRSVASLSCLHVAEHVGLGRYGDPLDPGGTRASAAELARVLAPGGTLWFGLPVGRPRTNFNAHRVHDPREVAGWFHGLRLDGFAGVDDNGGFLADADPRSLAGCEWGCGLYRFTRDA